MNLNDLDESLRSENPCWKGYKPVGTKKKGGRTVPNCVPESAGQGVAEGSMEEARGLASVNPYVELMQTLGWFMSMNTAKISQDAIDSRSAQELKVMQQQFNKPIINGKAFADVVSDTTMFKHPKVAPVLLKFAYDILGYIEPRIKKYIRPELQSKWMGLLSKLKDQYRAAIQFTSGQQGVAEGFQPVVPVKEISDEKRNKYVARASDDYGSSNFAARASKSHPGLEKYSQEQEARAKKRAAGLNRALSDKRTGREQGVAEGSDHSLKKVWDRYSKHLQAGRGDHSDIRQINKSGKILQDIRKYVRDHHGQKAVDDMERYAERRQWDEGVAEGGFENMYAEFSGYGNYMQGRAVNVFKKAGLAIVGKEYSEDDDIQTYVVKGDRWSIEKAGEYLERNPEQFGGYHFVKQGVVNEFAPGSGGGESGRWYTDDQLTDIVGDGWWNDLDVSGDIPKQQMIQEAQAWLDDQGYNVQVLNCRLNDDNMDWYIEGSFHNPGFAKKGVAEAGYSGADDTDTVGFSVNSEQAYQAVMARFGDHIDHDETSGIMYVPARMWPQVEMVAFDADGEGATREDSLEESNGFHAVLSFTDGSQQDMRLANPSNPVKQVLSYMIRRKDIDALKRLVTIDGINVKNIVSQLMAGRSNQVNLESRVANMNNTINSILEAAEKIGGRHAPADFDAMVGRVGQQAKQGPMQTVWDPVKRVYKVVPVNKK